MLKIPDRTNRKVFLKMLTNKKGNASFMSGL
jgi:hypothetical protein